MVTSSSTANTLGRTVVNCHDFVVDGHAQPGYLHQNLACGQGEGEFKYIATSGLVSRIDDTGITAIPRVIDA